MLRIAEVVGKPLAKADWYHRYTSRHTNAAVSTSCIDLDIFLTAGSRLQVADGFLEEHTGGALSVTPKARLRYVFCTTYSRPSTNT